MERRYPSSTNNKSFYTPEAFDFDLAFSISIHFFRLPIIIYFLLKRGFCREYKCFVQGMFEKQQQTKRSSPMWGSEKHSGVVHVMLRKLMRSKKLEEL
jgi:hypothetical protein